MVSKIMAMSSSTSSAKSPRILACVLCQNRKVKCDRRSPCSNCIKANVQCIPSTPAPARKRRRPNQDLQQRLARCEELLSEYATAKQPDNSDPSHGPKDSRASKGKLVPDQVGGMKFTDSLLWSGINDELHAMREILDVYEKDRDDDCSTPADDASPEDNIGFLLHNTPSVELRDLHPPPAHIFYLWQKFLDRVNPLTKVIHVPTLQPIVAEAATNLDAVPQNVEALLFAIFTMAAVSLTEEESLTFLGYSKKEATERFSSGVRVALKRIDILKHYDLIILQAMVLYMTSLFRRYDRHAAWILNGVIVRMGQKIGLHRDGESLGLPPFEAEMRRRVWWQIIMLDTIYALMSGLGQSLLPRNWDTRAPHNVSDQDLFPTMTSIQSKEGPTDMIFCLMQYEMAKLIVRTPGLEILLFRNDAPTEKDIPEITQALQRLDELETNTGRMLEKYCDLSMGPVHELAKEMRPNWLSKLRDVIELPTKQGERGVEFFNTKDNLFKVAVTSGEHNNQMHEVAQRQGNFMWFVLTHFETEMFAYLVGQLTSRTEGNMVERGWTVVERVYAQNQDLYDFNIKPHAALAKRLTMAWKVRERVLCERQGTPPQVPHYIVRLRDLLAAYESKINTPSNDTVTMADSIPEVKQDIAKLDEEPHASASWDQMLGFIDAGSLNWDTNLSGDWHAAQMSHTFPNFGHPNGDGFSNGWV